ncbi:putative protein kinase RLK-Pelle-DLSV family [Rosa chinensis]|uniref:Receptor-like serine/threonine-protein kinase n=1 Tax=Rosa chinensis TaxID=74649 RepID=A0A2P6QBI2_ROSCH|nr:putative protein kinase RLK-Pelle-DLSV family [Rosa chinensis]
MGDLCFVVFSTSLLFLLFTASFAVDSISPSQSISDNGSALVSSDGTFELGFFSPGNSKHRYVGIWYKNIPVRTVVWVANRCNPIDDSSGVLMINSTGYLVLLGQNKSVVWWTSLAKYTQSVMVQLLDSGNLVVRDVTDGKSLWQSFDYPSDTLLPEMKMGRDFRTGLKRELSAWKNSEDPCPGEFTYGIEMEPHANPEAYLRKSGVKFYRSGPWNGLRFSGAPELGPNSIYSFDFVYNDDEVYYMYKLQNKSVISIVVLNGTRSTRPRLTWIEAEQTWRAATVSRDFCDQYGLCGANAECIVSNNPVCQCLQGFTPMSPEKWNLTDWSLGCTRKKPQSCQESDKDGFVKFTDLKLPDTTHSWVNKSMNIKECRAECLNNCSCMAYTSSDIRAGGSGCAIWFGDLLDIRQFPGAGQDLYIRMLASEIDTEKREGAQKEDLELPLFNTTTIATATDNFSDDKKLGEGGFGPVYRGTLADGQEFAVKRLSSSSSQGFNEFMNEIIMIAKLQHRNLVKILGCCVQEEKMLMYEYMPNGSLDNFIFDQTRAVLLDWPKRFHIICGIARGLLYLHQDSRLRIIHRDLKASNVLLDDEMNPKISDFGLARILTGGDQTGGNTKRVVGTYGYMAPEYAADGVFSVKSDVFSFGILAWRLWNEGRPLELIDSWLKSLCNLSEVLRCIQVSLLCIQHHPENRPSMASVVIMLGSDIALAQPKQPGFFLEKEHEAGPDIGNESSTNEISISLLEAR